jgi:hypothetical protein
MSSMHASELFATTLRGSSNMEMDWLWLATRVASASEQRYCYGRALHLNPESAEALAGLVSTHADHAAPRSPSIWGQLVSGIAMAR